MLNHISDQEEKQSKARIWVCVVALLFHLALFLLVDLLITANLVFISIYATASISWRLWIKSTPNQYPARKYAPILPDMAINCLMMASLGDYSVYFYPLFLWMIVGYGMRYGQRYLYFSWLTAILLFLVMLYSSPFWGERPHLGVSLFLGLAILPFFYVSLVKKLHDELEEKRLGLLAKQDEIEFLKAVNSEIGLSELAITILAFLQRLFPQTKAAEILVVSENQNLEAIKKNTDGLSLSQDEVKEMLRESKLLSAGVYVLKQNGFLSHLEECVTIAITVHQEDTLLGLILFDCIPGFLGLEHLDNRKLETLKYHSTSSLSKTWLLSELKKRNTELEMRQGQLVLQEKMASLGKVATVLAHEFQNPLNFINNFSAIADEQLYELTAELCVYCRDNNEGVDHTLKEMRVSLGSVLRHGKKLSSLVNTMQALAFEQEVGNLSLNDIIRDCVNVAITPESQERVALSFKLDPELEFCNVDGANIVRRALVNIIKNSFEAVENHLETSGSTPVVSIATQKLKNQILISVHDNGGGVPIEDSNRIYDPFYTTKPQGQGHIGLGLTISYDGVINKLGGSINHFSKNNETCFEIMFPTTLTI